MNHPFYTRPGQRAVRRSILTSSILPVLLTASSFGVDWNGPVALDTASAPDDISVLGNSVVTLSGVSSSITETSITFKPAGATETLQVDGVGFTLRAVNTVLSIANSKTITVSGSADFAPGALSTGPTVGVATDTAIILVKNGGAGSLILDDPTNTLTNATLRAINGVISVVGGGPNLNPISSLTTAIELGTGTVTASPVLRLSSTGGDMAFVNKFRVLNTATIDHSAATNDTLASATDVQPFSTGKTLTVNVSNGGSLTINGTVGVSSTNSNNAGGNVVKTGADTLSFPGVLNVMNLNVADGRVNVPGQFKTTSNPLIGANGVLSLTNVSTSQANVLPATITVSTGTLEGTPGAFVNSPGVQSTLALAGGTLNLGVGTVNPGLIAHLYNSGSAGAQNAFGGPLHPANTFTTYTNYFSGQLPGSDTVAVTSGGGVTELSFGSFGDTPMFQVIAPTYTRKDEIVARLVGKIQIAAPGLYTFGTSSDDGSMLFIDGNTVVSNNNSQGNTRRSGQVSLAAGLHDIDIGYYEGGGQNGLIVDYNGPDTTGTQTTIPNSVLLPLDSSALAFLNPIVVSQNSVVNTATGASVPSVNLTSAGKVLNVNGFKFDMGAVTLTGTGTHTINANTQFSEVIARSITDGGVAVSVVNGGPGMLILESGASPQLQNIASTVSSAALGVVLGGAGGSPTGNAAISTNGRSLTLSSKGGNQTYTPVGMSFTAGGSINAARIGSGVAGTVAVPIRTFLTPAISLNPATNLQLASQDNYILNVSSITGGGSIFIPRGAVETSAAVALTGTGQITVLNANLSTLAGASAGAITVTDGTLANTGALTSGGGVTVTRSTLSSTGALTAGGVLSAETSTVTASAGTNAASIVLLNSSLVNTGNLVTGAAGVALTNSTLLNTGNLTTGAAGVTLTAGMNSSVLELRGGAISGGSIAGAGAIVRATSGVTLSNAGIAFTELNSSGLNGRLINHGGTGRFYPAQTEAGLTAIQTLPANGQAVLNGALSFLPYQNADTTIRNFFGGSVDTTNEFGLGFFGEFTPLVAGSYQFQVTQVDDDAGFWIDLDGDGLFRVAGTAGSELISERNCCGDGGIGSVNLVAGRRYKVAIAVEDGQGGSSLEAKIGFENGGLTNIDTTDTSLGMFTYTVPNLVTVNSGAELDLPSINGPVTVVANGVLKLTSASSTIDSLTIGAGGFVTLGGGAPAPANAALPVPEPGSLGLAFLGVLGLLARRSRAGRV